MFKKEFYEQLKQMNKEAGVDDAECLGKLLYNISICPLTPEQAAIIIGTTIETAIEQGEAGCLTLIEPIKIEEIN